MRDSAKLRRGLLAATWLAGTLVATGIVYEAVNVVAGQVTGQRLEPISQSAVGQALARSPAPAASPSKPATTPSAATASPSVQPTPGSAGGSGGVQPTPAVTGAPPSTRTFALVGGAAGLTCTGGQISLDWATPNSGFQVATGTSDGGSQVEVRFRSDTHESRLESWCSAGQVQGSVQEESS